jgi:hypothetical protein
VRQQASVDGRERERAVASDDDREFIQRNAIRITQLGGQRLAIPILNLYIQIPMKKNNAKLQLKKVTIRVLPHSELTNIIGGTCLEPTRGVQCAALVSQDQEK